MHTTLRSFLILILAAAGFKAQAQQDPAAIQAKCNQDLGDLRTKQAQCNADWEQTQKDLRAGLYCSQCHHSKTELDRSYPGGFYKHVKDVNGKPEPATQAMMTEAYNRYVSNFNSIANQLKSKEQSCQQSYSNAVDAQNRARQQAQQAAQAKAQSDAAARQQAAAAAQAKAQAEAQARQQAAIQEMQQKIQAEQARQQAIRDNAIQTSQQIAAQATQLKADMMNSFQSSGDQQRNEINQMKGQLNNMGNVSYGSGTSGNVSAAGSAAAYKSNGTSADDFTPAEEEYERWHKQTVAILEEHQRMFDLQQQQRQQTQDNCDGCYSSTSYGWKDVKEYVSGLFRSKQVESTPEYYEKQYPEVQHWYSGSGSVLVTFVPFVNSGNSAYQSFDKAVNILPHGDEDILNGDIDEMNRRWNNYPKDMAKSMPVVGGVGTVYEKMQNFWQNFKSKW